MEPILSLKLEYHVELVVVEAVQSELEWILQRRFSNKLPVFRKALRKRTLSILDSDFLENHAYGSAAVMSEINRLGREFVVRVDRGEAYTHAAGNILRVPTLSQDIVALRKLRDAGIYVERPILRAFDILVFGLQIAKLTQNDCEQARKDLRKSGQELLRCFVNCSVQDGLASFYARLLDREHPELGAALPVDPFDERLWLSAVATPPNTPA